MKLGVVPLVNDLQGGLNELVQNDITGYVVTDNNIFEYADVIEMLRLSSERLNQLSINAKKISADLFDAKINTRLIERAYFNTKVIQKKHSKKIYGSFLDQKYLLNFITYYLRNVLNSLLFK